MKTLTKALLFLCMGILISSCSKEVSEPSPGTGTGGNQDTTKSPIDHPIDLIWQVPLAPGLELANSDFAVLTDKDKVIYRTLLATSYEGLFACNRQSGEKLWDWDQNGRTNIHSRFDIISDEGFVYLRDRPAIYKVDAKTGKTLWTCKSPVALKNITKIGNFIYSTGEHAENGFPVNTLNRTHIVTGRLEQLYEINTINNDSLEPSLAGASYYIKPNLDTLLFITNRNLQFGTWERRVDLIAYNLQKREIEWMNSEACPKGVGTRHLPIIYNDLIYLKGSEHVMCFDPVDGSKIWEVGPMSGNAHVPLLFAEGKLFVNPDGRELMALDPKTGETIWKLEGVDGPASALDMVYHDGKLYTNGITGFTSKLHCFDPSNGELLWSMRSPNLDKFRSGGYSNTDGGLTIDPELEYLYITDGHFNQCFDLTPE